MEKFLTKNVFENYLEMDEMAVSPESAVAECSVFRFKIHSSFQTDNISDINVILFNSLGYIGLSHCIYTTTTQAMVWK